MDVSHLLTDTITISKRTGQDVHNNVTYGPQLTVAARVESAYALELSLRQPSLNFSHAVCLEQPLSPGDRVWIDSDNTGSTDAARQVIKSASAYTGDDSYQLYMAYL